jgi:transcriptional regulator GlxA family with amidase domain
MRLSRLHDAATKLAATVPDVLAHPEVARAIEQELLRAAVGCIVAGSPAESKVQLGQRASVMRRFERVLEENEGGALYVAEICEAVGVSERTLRTYCMKNLGVNPHRYLWLRRMKLARRALTLADRAADTVTEIATAYGFWELGRFAVAYGELFGEAPSTTLRRERAHHPAAPQRRLRLGNR